MSDYVCEVTTYKGEPATDSEIRMQIERLRRNYTQMKPDFFAVLANELMSEQWTAERIKDAVTHILRTKTGGWLTVADIFSYDRPFKLYTHSGYQWLINNNRAKDVDGCGEKSDFGIWREGGMVFFCLKKDLIKKT